MQKTNAHTSSEGRATPALLAIDAGQTGVRALVVRGEHRQETAFAGLKTDRELFGQLAQIINAVLDNAEDPVTLAIGMTGLTVANSRPDELIALLSSHVHRVYLAHDSITGFLGSMGVEQGTVTAVGTGVVTLAVGETEWARVDGWGNLIGDTGSAYWIGRAGLEAAMRAYDGRIPPTQLSVLVNDNFTNPEEAYIELQTSDDRVAKIAALAKDIIALADSDSAAREIVESAGRELAHSAVTAARRTGLFDATAPRFSWAGNVMRASVLRNAFVQSIRDALPGSDIREPLGEPIDGVALLPSVRETSPIADEIYRAQR